MAQGAAADTAKTLKDDNFEIKLINDYKLEYWDYDVKAPKDMTALNPKAPSGFYSLGTVVIPSATNDEYPLLSTPGGESNKPFPSLKNIETYTFVLKPLPGKDDLLKKPTGFKQVWDDSKTGGNRDGSFYVAKCPSGYGALGGIVSRHYDLEESHDDSRTGKFRCVKKTLLVEANYKTDPIWTDKGSDAPKNGSFWAVTAPQSKKHNQLVMAYNGSYPRGQERESSYAAPSSTAYAIKFTFSEAPDLAGKLSTDDQKKLKAIRPVLSEAFALEVLAKPDPITIVYDKVPFFMVNDEKYDLPTRWAKYPYYKIIRKVTWHHLESRDNTGDACIDWGEADSYQVSYERGVESVKSWDNSVGLEIGATNTAEITPLGVGEKLETSINVSYSHNFGGSDAVSTSKGESFDVKQIPGTFTAVFQVGNDYETFRRETNGKYTSIKKSDGNGFIKSGRDGDVDVVRYKPAGWTKDDPCLSKTSPKAEPKAEQTQDITLLLERGNRSALYAGAMDNERDYDTMEDTKASQIGEDGEFHLLSGGHTLAKDFKHWSKSKNHYLVFIEGDLQVMDKNDNYVWSMRDQMKTKGHVATVVYQHDGNLAAYTADGGYMWSALHKAPAKGTELQLDDKGILRIVQPDTTILWTSAE